MKKTIWTSLLLTVLFFGGCLRIPAIKADGLQAPYQGGASITVDQEIVGNEDLTETDKKAIDAEIAKLQTNLKTTIDNGAITFNIFRTIRKVEIVTVALRDYISVTGRQWKVGDTCITRIIKIDGVIKVVEYENGKLQKSMKNSLNKSVSDRVSLKN